MPVQIPASYALPEGDKPLTHSRIAHAGNWIAGTVSASSTDANPIYHAEAPASSLLFERWKPAALPASWQIDAGAPVEVDYCAIAAHDLAAAGATVRAQYRGGARSNLLRYSRDFSQGWSEYRCAVVPDPEGIVGGVSGAVRFSDSGLGGGGAAHCYIYPSVSAAETYSISIWVRAGSLSWFAISFLNGGVANAYAYFDLATGGVGYVDPAIGQTKIEDFGSGWWRVSCVVTIGADPSNFGVMFHLAKADGDRNLVHDGSHYLHIFGPQLEGGSAPTGYIETAASVVSSDWHDLSFFHAPETSGPILKLFEPVTAQEFRVEVTGDMPAPIGFIRFGKALQMEERTRYAGRTPFDLARETVMTGNASVRGEFLSRVLLRAGQSLPFTWSHLSEEFTRGPVKELIDAIEGDLFVIADRPGTHPDDVAICWLAGSRPRPTASGAMDLHDLAIEAQGYLQHE